MAGVLCGGGEGDGQAGTLWRQKVPLVGSGGQ